MFQQTDQKAILLNEEYMNRTQTEARQHQLADELTRRGTPSLHLPSRPMFLSALILIALALILGSTGKAQAQGRDIALDAGSESNAMKELSILSLMRYGLYDEAIESLSMLIAEHPDNAGAYALRGHAHFLNGDHESAKLDSEIAIEIAPDYASPYWTLGEMYFAEEDYLNAEIQYANYIDLAGDDAIETAFAKIKLCKDYNTQANS